MSEYEREVELIDFIEVVLKRKWLILLATLACMAGAAVHRTEAPRLFQASNLLLIAPSQTQAGVLAAPATLAAKFYTSVALADEMHLAIGRYSDRLVDSLALEPAAVSLKAEVVDNTGIRLTAISENPELPVPVVRAYTDTFLARTVGFTATESRRFYEFVSAQYDTAQRKLEEADAELLSFEKEERIAFLEQRSGLLSSEIALLQSDEIQTRSELGEKDAELRRTREIVEALEVDGVPIFMLDMAEMQTLNSSARRELTRESLRNILELEKIGGARRDFELRAQLGLLEFERESSYSILRGEVQTLSEASDTLIHVVSRAWAERIGLEQRAEAIERELSKHEPGIARTRPTTEKLSEALDKRKLYFDEPNPAYLSLELQGAEVGVRLETAYVHLVRGESKIDEVTGRLDSLRRILYKAQHRYEALVATFDQERSALAAQEEVLIRIYHNSQQRYVLKKRTLASLVADVQALRQELADKMRRLESTKETTASVLDQMNYLVARREGLNRAKEAVAATVGRFAILAEEARITRQRAMSNLRIVTRAETYRAVPFQSNQLGRIPLSGAVGLIVSMFVAFLLEYVRKARALRQDPANASAM